MPMPANSDAARPQGAGSLIHDALHSAAALFLAGIARPSFGSWTG